MDKLIAHLNGELFERGLAQEQDEAPHEVLRSPLAKEEKLRTILERERARAAVEINNKDQSARPVGGLISRGPIAPMCRGNVHPFFRIGSPPSSKRALTWENESMGTIVINNGELQLPPERGA